MLRIEAQLLGRLTFCDAMLSCKPFVVFYNEHSPIILFRFTQVLPNKFLLLFVFIFFLRQNVRIILGISIRTQEEEIERERAALSEAETLIGTKSFLGIELEESFLAAEERFSQEERARRRLVHFLIITYHLVCCSKGMHFVKS